MPETNNPPNENPYRSTDAGHGTPGMGVAKAVACGVAAFLVLLLVAALLMPANRGGREAARRNSCINNEKQIVLALLNYESEHGEFPPAYTVDADGNRLHSWRTLLLPYLEGDYLYEKIDLSKPWDDEANAEVRQACMEEYLCPSSAAEQENLTNYMVVTGPECVFNGSTPCKLADIEDGTSSTIMVVEVAGRQVEWMQPDDITLEEFLTLSDETPRNHPGGIIVGFADGSVTSVDVDIDREQLRAMATRAGHEPVGDE